jgi:hypothetical protein
MDIKKFGDFINEDVKILVLDVLIDDNGNLYNGNFGFPLRKGNIVQAKDRSVESILGNDNKSYPAGIDKNGYITSTKSDEEGFVLNSLEQRIAIPDQIYNFQSESPRFNYSNKFPDRYWKVKHKGVPVDYSFLMPIVPTGWVNVKVDMEVIKRVKRYSKGLGSNNRGFNSFVAKLNDLKRMSSGIQYRKRSRETIQKEMSVVILLHYINEIKNFFTPSSSGFLFESFLAGLIPNAKVNEDNSKTDVISNGEHYQIKLYSSLESSVSIAYNRETNDDGVTTDVPLDYYLVCLKYADKVDIHILSGKNENDTNYYRNFLTDISNRTRNGVQYQVGGSNFSITKIKAMDEMKFSIELNNIEEKIEKIALNLKETLDKLYSELSSFQFNVETIISGVDEKGNIIDDAGFNVHSSNALENLVSMDRELNILLNDVLG